MLYFLGLTLAFFYILSARVEAEPQCSPYDFFERTIEKVVRMEQSIENTRDKMKTLELEMNKQSREKEDFVSDKLSQIMIKLKDLEEFQETITKSFTDYKTSVQSLLDKKVADLENYKADVQAALERQKSDLRNYKGSVGPKGEPGEIGSPGVSGAKGQKGEPSRTGILGRSSVKGQKGERGVSGLDGLPGSRGLPGPKGETGYKGGPAIIGPKGEPGRDGLPGVSGFKGQKGEPGKNRLSDSQGRSHAKGQKGESGNPGLPGRDGYPGLPGLKGQPGLPGLPGRRENEVIVFKAKDASVSSFHVNDVIVFPTVVVNERSAYDSSTGIFTAPVHGLYLFTAQICLNRDMNLRIQIMADDKVISAASYQHNHYYVNCHTSDGFAVLEKGNEAKVILKHTRSRSIEFPDDPSDAFWTSFSGALIQGEN